MSERACTVEKTQAIKDHQLFKAFTPRNLRNWR